MRQRGSRKGVERSRSPRLRGQEGAALVLAILVMGVLTALGVSLLLIAHTENRVAENERLSAQALYLAEAGARQVKRWFDHPRSTVFNLSWPPPAAVDRSLRRMDTDGEGPAPAVRADGSAAAPYYKQGVDLDGDGIEDVFDRPYRGDAAHALLGTEDGPDMALDEGASAEARSFLADLSERLLSSLPSGGAGLEARIARVDVYGPPCLHVAGAWTRYGIATVKVTARIHRRRGGSETVLAERTVRAVLSEAPYRGPFGPLHSCRDLSFDGPLTARWGAVVAVGGSDLTDDHGRVAVGWPRAAPVSARRDLLWGWDSDADFDAYKNAIDAMTVEDPWLRHAGGGAVVDPLCPGWIATAEQPCAFAWAGGPVGDGQRPRHGPGSLDGTHSNVFQNVASVTCPDFGYGLWKGVAASGGSDVHYYVWDSGDAFREHGSGSPRSFRDLSDGREGLFFFDTRDRLPPSDDDGDGLSDNLTPPIEISGGVWGTRGLLYLNAEWFRADAASGRPAVYRAPGEPWQDKDRNGRYDAGEDWLNLAYPTGLADPFVADRNDALGGSVQRNRRGPAVHDEAGLWGILYTSGFFDATGRARYLGSVVSRQGVGARTPSADTPDLYWDESIVEGWPPEGWNLPRVVVTAWDTDL